MIVKMEVLVDLSEISPKTALQSAHRTIAESLKEKGHRVVTVVSLAVDGVSIIEKDKPKLQ